MLFDFSAAPLDRTVYGGQHLSFLLHALLFWAALFEKRRHNRYHRPSILRCPEGACSPAAGPIVSAA
jgi:hypothetical protein